MEQKDIDVTFTVDTKITPQEFKILLGKAIYGRNEKALKELDEIVKSIRVK
jgi:hypothetical protein